MKLHFYFCPFFHKRNVPLKYNPSSFVKLYSLFSLLTYKIYKEEIAWLVMSRTSCKYLVMYILMYIFVNPCPLKYRATHAYIKIKRKLKRTEIPTEIPAHVTHTQLS